MAGRDRLAELFAERTVRRAIAVAALVGTLVAFRPLLLLLVFFVAFERAIGWASSALARRAKLGPRASVLAVLGGAFVLAGGAAALGANRAAHAIVDARDSFPARFASMKESALFLRVREHLPDTEKVVESAQHHAQEAMHVAAQLGHMVAYALIGLILAVVYRLEHEELGAFADRLEPRSLIGTLVRWFGHVADAIAVTVQLQLLVAAFNAVTTVPVMLLLGMNHVVPLMILVFASALVPVVGNLVSGVVLCLLAYEAKGWAGVAIFVGLTFVLHKIEAYYLNPRLTARHVRLPGFVLIVSLLAFEHTFGFAGLFLSFPFLFVAGRIRAEWAREDGVALNKAPPAPELEGGG